LMTRPPSTRKTMCPRNESRRGGPMLRRIHRAAAAQFGGKARAQRARLVSRGQAPRPGSRRSPPPAGVHRSQIGLPGMVHRLEARPAGTERCECAGTLRARPRRWKGRRPLDMMDDLDFLESGPRTFKKLNDAVRERLHRE
jgi:hypothetical protein